MAVVLCLSLFCSFSAGASDSTSWNEPRVVFVKSDLWESDLLVSGATASGVAIGYRPCAGGWVSKFTLSQGETRLAKNFSEDCAAQVGLAVFATLGGSATFSTLARFRDSFGNVANFEIPALSWALPEYKLEARAIQSDENFLTSFYFFNEGDRPDNLTISLYDERNQKVADEGVSTRPGELTIYTVAAQFRVGRAVVTAGTPGFGCVGCQGTQPVYGFAAVNWRAGGSPRIVTLQPAE